MASRSKKTTGIHPKHHPWILVLIGIFSVWFFLELIGWGIFHKVSPAIAPTTPKQLPAASAKTFTASSVMGGFTIQVPAGFEVEETVGAGLKIKKANQVIYVSMNTTDFNNLKDYLANLDKLNKTTISNESNLKINNLSAAKRTYVTNSKETQISYVVYVSGYIYNIYTNSVVLETSLDQIAQSFRIPEK